MKNGIEKSIEVMLRQCFFSFLISLMLICSEIFRREARRGCVSS